MKALTIHQPWASLCVIPRPACGEPCPGRMTERCQREPGHAGEHRTRHRSSPGTVLAWPGGYPVTSVPAHMAPDPMLPFKTIETRGWPAPKSLIGQRIAIHAALDLSQTPGGGERCQACGRLYGDVYWLPDDWWCRITPRPDSPVAGLLCRRCAVTRLDLPLGAVVGTAVLADCVPMVPEYTDDRPILHIDGEALWLWGRNRPGWPYEMAANVRDQRPFGLFEPGRWAWLLADVERFDEPIPARGGQRIWNWEQP